MTVRSRTRTKRSKTSATPDQRLVTSERILHAARRVLVDDGFAKFTTRRIAEAVGITVGNLGYHFPSKRDLVRAVINSLLDMYAERFRHSLRKASWPQAMLSRA